MSVASKRRFVTNKVESEMYLPNEGDVIAQVKAARGNNLHEVEDQCGNTYCVSMPTKFRKAVWIKRGQFVIIRPIDEGDKVKAEIEQVLDEENVLYIREMKQWPEHFEDKAEQMTRDAKRGTKGDHPMIDDDMLPPSDSEDEDEEEMEDEETYDEDLSEAEDDDEEEEEARVFNPNRSVAPKNM